MSKPFTVKMIRGFGFNDAEWAMQLEADYWWAKCWNDPGFQNSVLDYSWTTQSCTGFWRWKTCKPVTSNSFTYTDHSKHAILGKMLSGAEDLKPEADGVADGTVEIGNQRGVIGWTNEQTLTEWLSKWFVDSSSIPEQAGNRAHEYMHKLGYDHPYNNTWDRPYSVPYAIGDLTVAWVEKNFVAGEYQGFIAGSTASQSEALSRGGPSPLPASAPSEAPIPQA